MKIENDACVVDLLKIGFKWPTSHATCEHGDVKDGDDTVVAEM